MLDPRLKTSTFPSETEKEEALDAIKQQMIPLLKDSEVVWLSYNINIVDLVSG